MEGGGHLQLGHFLEQFSSSVLNQSHRGKKNFLVVNLVAAFSAAQTDSPVFHFERHARNTVNSVFVLFCFNWELLDPTNNVSFVITNQWDLFGTYFIPTF